MEDELAELLSLFITEARGRLERLHLLAPSLRSDSEAVKQARRELHALKGAGLMMNFDAIAGLCHRGEELLQAPGQVDERLLTEVMDALDRGIDAVSRGGEPHPSPSNADPEETRAAERLERPRPGARIPAPEGVVRIPSIVLDDLADRATQVRIAAISAGALVQKLGDLADLAGEGAGEGEPRRVLAAASSAMRRLRLELDAQQQRLFRAADRQLEELLELEVQPLRSFLVRLARHARELARSMGKEIEIEIQGEDTQLDRRIVGALEEAFVHLVRNAVDHGIEPPDERLRRGKRQAGKLRIEARPEGSRVRMEVSDDGRGVDVETVAEAARRSGLLDAAGDSDLDPQEVLRLLFSAGFSTRRTVSEVSGRGIGLDAVATAVALMGGEIGLDSEPGRGTRMFIDLPAVRRGEAVVVVRAGRRRAVLPAPFVRRYSSLEAGQLVASGERRFRLHGNRPVPVVLLAELLGEEPGDLQVVVEGQVAGAPLDVIVDAVEGEEEVLVSPLRQELCRAVPYDGMALLADGQPVAVLSAARLPRATGTLGSGTAPSPAARSTPRVLLADDSLVTREMERRLLEDAGFDVATVGDAKEALRELSEHPFDCLVADIEMPGMDGLELTRRLRASSRFASLPIVVVSTRNRPQDRLAGLEAGADAYLTKQGLDPRELIGIIRRVGGRE